MLFQKQQKEIKEQRRKLKEEREEFKRKIQLTEQEGKTMEAKMPGRVQELEAKMRHINKTIETPVVREWPMKKKFFKTKTLFSYKTYNVVNNLWCEVTLS